MDELSKNERREILSKRMRQIYDHFGGEEQMLKTIEELGELQVALTRFYQHRDEENRAAVEEELADVMNMSEQMTFLFGDVDSIRRMKAERTIERIEE